MPSGLLIDGMSNMRMYTNRTVDRKYCTYIHVPFPGPQDISPRSFVFGTGDLKPYLGPALAHEIYDEGIWVRSASCMHGLLSRTVGRTLL